MLQFGRLLKLIPSKALLFKLYISTTTVRLEEGQGNRAVPLGLASLGENSPVVGRVGKEIHRAEEKKLAGDQQGDIYGEAAAR